MVRESKLDKDAYAFNSTSVSEKSMGKLQDLYRKGQWACHLEGIKPQGLNNGDFFFNQTRSGGERKS